MMDAVLDEFASFERFTIDDFYVVDSPAEFHRMTIDKTRAAGSVCLACLCMDAGDEARVLIDALAARRANKQPTTLYLDRYRNMGNAALVEYLNGKELWDNVRLVDRAKFKFLPKMLNELLGVYHLKAYVFDDEVCISGANLSSPYFVDRVDRYYFIKHRGLADYISRHVHNYNYTNCKDDNLKIVDETEEFIARARQPQAQLSTRNTIQIFHYTEKEELDVLAKLFNHKYERVFISTAYPNLTRKHKAILGDVPFELCIPSVRANTFNNDSRLGKFISDVYDYSACKIKRAMPNACIREYQREKHSFHAKGMWLFAEDFCVTIIGSSNFNQRSVQIDEESTWVIISDKPSVRAKLAAECETIRTHSQAVSAEALRSRRSSIFIAIIFYLMNAFI
ncbi:CDP-diacylglycerol---glycerol-3-phosphate 3-phosphatidyltransferase [Pancytospora philotis]|nr:CDP-diacylglycerol---glycerol-3-phosphate 3-phosphatidyltransferase [Pancytospora philotis]